MGKGWERPDGLPQRSPATASRHKQLKLVPLYVLEGDATFSAKKKCVCWFSLKKSGLPKWRTKNPYPKLINFTVLSRASRGEDRLT